MHLLENLAAEISELAEVDVNELTAGTTQTIDLTVHNNAEVTNDLKIGGKLIIGETTFDPTKYVTSSALTSRLSGYATQSWVTDKGYITGADLTTGVTTKSLYIPTDGKITIPSGADLRLFGYAPRWNQMQFLKSATLSVTRKYLNIRLADGTTTGNIDVVTNVSLETTPDTISYLYRGS